MQTIVVQMSDEKWTAEAIHLASALARSIDGKIVLLYLILANNPGLLGWDIAPPTAQERHQIKACADIAEDYGVKFCVQPMQFISLMGALAQAVELLRANVLFAHIAQSSVPLWQRFQLWSLRRQLHNCRIYTLDEEQPLSLHEPTLSTVVWKSH